MSSWRLFRSLHRVCSLECRPSQSFHHSFVWSFPNLRAFSVLGRQQNTHVKTTNASILEFYKNSLDYQNDDTKLKKFEGYHDLGQVSINKLLHGDSNTGRTITLDGYLGHARTPSKNLSFVEFFGPELEESIQLVSVAQKIGTDSHDLLRRSKSLTPVRIQGELRKKSAPKDGEKYDIPNEIELSSLQVLNKFPINIDVSATFGPDQRHLQLKTNAELRGNLKFRSRVYAQVIRLLHQNDFVHVETPLLFKSTSEGAREFLVPTRRDGLAYALPQSPQQYKQILMASGISKYYQMARCFRDEDMRADRQPEFTQIDLECAFADGQEIMRVVEDLVKGVLMKVRYSDSDDPLIVTVPNEESENDRAHETDGPNWKQPFLRITYDEAMSQYGSDKPDLRLNYNITRIDHLLPVDLISKISSLNRPRVDITVFRMTHDLSLMRNFYHKFLDSPEVAPYHNNPDGGPGIFIYDSKKPLSGLQAFGFEAAEEIERRFEPSDGDLIVLQARPDTRFTGGSTALGRFMIDLNKASVSNGLKSLSNELEFLWVTDFPLFTPSSAEENGQFSAADLQSTHHPFTSPKTPQDVDLLLTQPLEVTGDHYDLVLNGVEIGGGSRRIHNAVVQRLIMEEVLKMPAEKIAEFEHLLEALRAGCPPHAGFALGFDRLIAVLLGKESVRDVIAFPKWGKGDDPMVQAPAKVSAEEWGVYKLRPS